MVKCEICGEKFKSVNALHLRVHNVRLQEYKVEYPNTQVHSDETRQKISKALTGKIRRRGYKLSDEHKRKLSLALLGNKRRLGIKPSENQVLAMRKPEVRARISQSRKEYFKNPENRQKHRERQLRVMGTPEARRNNSLARTGKVLSLEHRQSISQGVRANPNWDEWVAKLNKRMREWWEDEDNKAMGVRAILQACNRRPNKAEASLAVLLGEDWQYTGDGSLIIGGKCPDFWNGDHRLVELFGDFWHKGDNPQERIDLFAGYGYKCLVIWEHELADEDVTKQRIHDFSSCKI